jgi:uncharacterized protein (DUF433 family)
VKTAVPTKVIFVSVLKYMSGGYMTLIVEPQPIPLRKDPDGAWRVGNTRVLLDLVVYAFNAGRTPEEIIQSYDTLHLGDVYTVIAYYLAHRAEVDAYLQQQEEESEALWRDIKKRPDYQAFRKRLLARRATYQP